MLGKDYTRENCSAARALEVVGERWSLLIIRNAVFAGMTRFSEFEQRLGIAPNILAKRLQGFIEAGLMTTERDDPGGSGTYRLTPKGHELGSVIVALTDWGDRWIAPNGEPIVYRHIDCDGAVHMTATCDSCDAHPSIDEVVAAPGRGATEAQRAALEARLK